MNSVFNGRRTAELDGSFVVFIIGMRVNKLWAVHKWFPVARVMRRISKRGSDSTGCRSRRQLPSYENPSEP
jgi:fumigallin biosynthesis monooxygenase-like protein